MKDQVAVSLEERIFNDLNVKAQMQDSISSLLKNMLDRIKNILAVEKDSSEKKGKLLLIHILLIKAAIILDDVESIKLLISNIQTEPSDKYNELVIYAIKNKHLDLLDFPIICNTLENILLNDLTYKLTIFIGSDDDVIAKITSKISVVFNKIAESEQVSIADLGSLYKKSISYITKQDDKTNDNLVTSAIIKGDIFRLNKLLNSKDYNVIFAMDRKSLELFYQLNPKIFHDISQPEKNNMLLWLCQNPGVDQKLLINFILKIGADIEAKSDKGFTPLNLALQKGQIEIVKLLLKKGADIEARSNEGYTPLHLATCVGFVDIIKILLDQKADKEKKTYNNYTALHLASFNGHIEVVALLLSFSVDKEVRESKGQTALHLATINGHIKIVKLLLAKNAKINGKNSNGRTALHLAIYYKHTEIVKLLLERKADIDAKDSQDFTPLHHAAYHCHIEIVKLLLEKNANIDTKDKKSLTPLHHSAYHGRIEIVKLLLEKNASIEEKDSNALTPLHHAAYHGHIEIVKLLLEKNANIDAKDKNDLTPLHHAAYHGHIEIVKLLIECKADIEARSNEGFTPLHLALQNGQTEIAKLLIKRKADIKTKNNNGNIILHLVASNGHAEILELLLEYDIGKELLNHQDRDGKTALHFAVLNNFPKIVDLLLANDNIDLTLRESENSETALEIAKRLNLKNIMTSISEKEKELDSRKNIILVKRIFDSLDSKAKKQDIIPPLPEILDKIKNLLEEESKLLEIHILLMEAAIILDDVESIKVLISNIQAEPSNDYNALAKYAVERKHPDLLDHTLVCNALEKILLENFDYKLKVFLESDDDVIAKIISKIPGIFDKTEPEQVSIADLGSLYKKSIDHIAKQDDKTNDNLVTSEVINKDIFRLNTLLNRKDYTVIIDMDRKSLELFYQLNPEIFYNISQSEKNNMLFWLCQNSGVEQKLLINFILKIGAYINAKDSNDFTPLHYAAINGYAEVVRFLVTAGADIEIRTALQLSAQGSNIGIIQLLQEFTNNIKTPNNNFDGRHHLHNAALNGDIAAVTFLIGFGADKEARDNYGRSVLHYAVLSGNKELVEMLLNHEVYKELMINEQDFRDGATALHIAVFYDYKDIVELLLNAGADIGVYDNKNQKALYYAAKNSCIEVASLLVNQQLNKILIDNYGRSDLHYAALSCNTELVKILLNCDIYKQSINKKDLEYSATALHLAVFYGYKDIVELLLNSKADKNAKDNQGNTPLHLAVLNGDIPAVTLLLEKKADIEVRDNQGNTPLHLAEQAGNKKIIKLFLEFKGLKPLHIAVLDKDLSMVKFLLDFGVDINVKDNKGYTALHYAVTNNLPNIVDLLLATNNLDLTLRAGDAKETAFDIAQRLNLVGIMESISKKEIELAPVRNATWGEKISAQAAGNNREM
jgi:ankyrin repeat protein